MSSQLRHGRSNTQLTEELCVNKIYRSMDERMPRRDDVPCQLDEEGTSRRRRRRASIFYCCFIIEAKSNIRLSWILDYRVCSGYWQTRTARHKRPESMVIPRIDLSFLRPRLFLSLPLEWITKVPVRFYVATRTMRFHYIFDRSLRPIEMHSIHGGPLSKKQCPVVDFCNFIRILSYYIYIYIFYFE